MKYISYFFIAIASAFLVILLSLSSCSPNHRVMTSQPMVMEQPKSEPQTSQQTADATVKIHNFKFEPANLVLAVGKTVQFINVDEEPHTATATDGTFNSKALDTNETWNYIATKPGTYPYICSIHPFMKGTLTVTNKKN
ncbi:cupredoxin family copper-binding protein [Nostoc sp. FACHB-152]|uniref:cupredoxin domain-containing protein n=1 Tax=unclassified Nostoc TaxID=2593658 RepID=UPI0016898284|nr:MULTISPECIES: cupredoxin family copper-binding protein [unclassified Nostoc]MBD2452303.1 cupredoxin family copper-binding protein [Nostoc sp. FACHB-152]MBD2473267.1 cupredoxin family copper-binding protein [Nostoc sp. FACHB-145]